MDYMFAESRVKNREMQLRNKNDQNIGLHSV